MSPTWWILLSLYVEAYKQVPLIPLIIPIKHREMSHHGMRMRGRQCTQGSHAEIEQMPKTVKPRRGCTQWKISENFNFLSSGGQACPELPELSESAARYQKAVRMLWRLLRRHVTNVKNNAIQWLHAIVETKAVSNLIGLIYSFYSYWRVRVTCCTRKYMLFWGSD